VRKQIKKFKNKEQRNKNKDKETGNKWLMFYAANQVAAFIHGATCEKEKNARGVPYKEKERTSF
jgi:hypothetical protein